MQFCFFIASVHKVMIVEHERGMRQIGLVTSAPVDHHFS